MYHNPCHWLTAVIVLTEWIAMVDVHVCSMYHNPCHWLTAVIVLTKWIAMVDVHVP